MGEHHVGVGDRVNTLDGRPGSGTVHGTVERLGHVLVGIRPDPDDPNIGKVVVDGAGLIWRYDHDIYAPEVLDEIPVEVEIERTLNQKWLRALTDGEQHDFVDDWVAGHPGAVVGILDE